MRTARAPAGARAASGNTPLLLALLAGLAALPRLWGLGRESLWLDEAATWWNATRASWQATALAEPNHGPIWWLITRAFVLLLGDGESALRAPAAILGILAVPLTWVLARRLLDPARVPAAAGFRGVDPGAPFWVAALAAIHPFWIEYSQEARMYAALLAASLGLTLLFLNWLRTGRLRTLVSYAVLATIALYTHHFAVLTLLSHAVFSLVETLRRRARRERPFPLGAPLAAQACAIAAFFPWIVRSLLAGSGVETQGHFGTLQRALLALFRLMFGPSLAAVDRPRVDAGMMPLLREEAPVLLLGAAVGALTLLAGAWTLRRDPPSRNLVLSSILVPFGFLLLVYPRYPLLHEKYLIMTAPYLLLLAVLGARNAAGVLRPLLLAGLSGLILVGLLAYCLPGAPLAERLAVHGHPRGKEQWREARAWVAARAGPGDLVLLYPGFLHLPWDYYDRGRVPAVGLPARPASRDDLTRIAGGWDVAARRFLVSAAVRAEEREALVRDLSRWSGATGTLPDTTGLLRWRLFPRQWGVWVYEFRGPRDAGDRAQEPRANARTERTNSSSSTSTSPRN